MEPVATSQNSSTVTETREPYDPFVSTDTYKRDLYRPIRKPGDPIDEVIGWVELRALNAGDRAEFNELKLTQEGDGAMRVGLIQLLMVDRAVVAWSFAKSKTLETIGVLDPDVFDQMWEHVSLGNPTLADELEDLASADPPQAGGSDSPDVEPAEHATETDSPSRQDV
jgi:hypothetical protein